MTTTLQQQQQQASSMSTKRKKAYKELTLREKVELIRLAEQNSSLSQANIAERYAIAKSNVCRILQRKAEYLQAHKSAKFDESRKRKLRDDYHHQQHKQLEAAEEGNETLRAHMLKQHQISRMFMCRCCNWAFPDKTSLHMHMQLQNGGKNSGDNNNNESLTTASKISVIGRSSQSSPHTQTAAKSKSRELSGSLMPPPAPTTSIFNSSANSLLAQSKLAQQFFGGQPSHLFESSNAGNSGTYPMSAALLAAAANAGLQVPPPPQAMQQGLFAGLPNEAFLQALSMNQQSHMDKPNGNNGLFPQLSMMQRDNVDLLSKVRQRLFFTNVWASKLSQQNTANSNNGLKLSSPFNNDKLLAEFLENNNQLPMTIVVPTGSQQIGDKDMITGESSDDRTLDIHSPINNNTELSKLKKHNLAQLMQQLIHKGTANSDQEDNNNSAGMKNNNLVIVEADSNNNDSSTELIDLKMEDDGRENKEEEKLESTESHDDADESRCRQLNFVESTYTGSSPQNNSSSLANSSDNFLVADQNSSEQDGKLLMELSAQNRELMQRLGEFRQQLLDHLNGEDLVNTAQKQFLENLLKLTYLNQ